MPKERERQGDKPENGRLWYNEECRRKLEPATKLALIKAPVAASYSAIEVVPLKAVT